MNNKLNEFKKEYQRLASPRQAKLLSGFFKTGKGQYGEGDVFLGIKVPFQRAAVKKFYQFSLKDLKVLLNSKIHEYRLSGLFILVKQYEQACLAKDLNKMKSIYQFYLTNSARVNNWDLVDLSAPNIVGSYLFNSPRKILYSLARSKNLWQRRIAVLATYYFIRKNDFYDSLKICQMLLRDGHDLIHKASGWMLREIGKRDKAVLVKFLNKYKAKMPRVMLRYAIEKFPPSVRKVYLGKSGEYK